MLITARKRTFNHTKIGEDRTAINNLVKTILLSTFLTRTYKNLQVHSKKRVLDETTTDRKEI